MDADRFDSLTRSFTSRRSRRWVLAELAGGLIAALPFALGAGDATAKKKKKKKRKKPASPCVPACTGGRNCTSTGQCECPADRPHSGGFCDDTCRECCINDHCGQFNGKKCDHALGSICVCANPDNHDCGLLCTTCCVQEHCIPIIGDQSQCVDGGCRCHAGLTPCFDPVSNKNKCTDTRTDENNCGECGRDCPPGSECIDSNCA